MRPKSYSKPSAKPRPRPRGLWRTFCNSLLDVLTIDMISRLAADLRKTLQSSTVGHEERGGGDAPAPERTLHILADAKMLAERLVHRLDEQAVRGKDLQRKDSLTPATGTEYSSMCNTAIDVSDWVTEALTEERITKERLATVVLRKLREGLKKEGLTVLDGSGKVNPDIQQIVDTVATDDPGASGTVARTVRPGYMYRDKLIRPQEVIAFRH